MFYGILADITVGLHFIWILFVAVGILIALRIPTLVWVHLGGLLFSLVLNLGGWYCPLTHLETHLRRLAGPESTPYAGSFWVHYLERIIYLDLPARTIRVGEILFACLNLMVYGICFKRFFIHLRRKPRDCPWTNV